MDSVRAGPFGQLFRPDNFVFGQTGQPHRGSFKNVGFRFTTSTSTITIAITITATMTVTVTITTTSTITITVALTVINVFLLLFLLLLLSVFRLMKFSVRHAAPGADGQQSVAEMGEARVR